MKIIIRAVLAAFALCVSAFGAVMAQDGGDGPPLDFPTPVNIGPADLPPDVNPLTGIMLDDPTVLMRRPAAIKISNHPPKVRPQSGVNAADIVYEHVVEGQYTRFTAIFLTNAPRHVGPIRSARLIDIELLDMYGPLFSYSGASEGVRARLFDASIMQLISPDIGDGCPPFCRFPQPGLETEHTLYGDLQEIWALAEQRGWNVPEYTNYGMAFSTCPAEDAEPANTVTVAFTNAKSEWRYDPEAMRYLRWTDDQPHRDALIGEQLAFDNVIFLYAEHREDTTIREDEWGGGHFSIEARLWGTGEAYLFRDGRAVVGRWRRPDRAGPIILSTLDGEPLRLKPGKTWFTVVPLYMARPQFAAETAHDLAPACIKVPTDPSHPW